MKPKILTPRSISHRLRYAIQTAAISDDASIGVIVYSLMFVGVIAFVYMVFSLVIDPFQAQIATDAARGIPISAGRVDAMNTLTNGWLVLPAVSMILLFIWAVKTAISEKDSVV